MGRMWQGQRAWKNTMAAGALLCALGSIGCEQPRWDDPAYIGQQLESEDANARRVALERMGELPDDKKKALAPALSKVYLMGDVNQKDVMSTLASMRDPAAKEAYLKELQTDATGYAAASAAAAYATASRVVTPSTGMPQARAMPRAAASPVLSPVKDPGPTVTATRSRRSKVAPASRSTEMTIGISAAVCPRTIASKRRAATAPSRHNATETAAHAESSASIRITPCLPGAPFHGRRPPIC